MPRYQSDSKSTFAVALLGLAIFTVHDLSAQDTRRVVEPSFPGSCVVIHASLQTNRQEGLANQDDTNSISAAQTRLIQHALDACTPGQAVELALASSGPGDAFLINPLVIPTGVSLRVDGGVTVFGSRDPANYQASGTQARCGVISKEGGGCRPLLSFSGDSGLYGYGIVDGRGYAAMLSGPYAGKPWWDLTVELKPGQNQNIPKLIMATGNDFTVYKITLRNAPYYHLHWTGDGLTVWGIKLSSPWNVPNTDGINIWGTHATVKDSTISEGDDQIAIDAWKIPAGQITIDHVTGYSRNGLSIGSGITKGVSDVLVENSNLTGSVVSLRGSTVNGMPLRVMESYGIVNYQQALPTRATKIRGLNIKTRPAIGGFVRNVTYKNICMKDLNIPIEFAPYFGRIDGDNYPPVEKIAFDNIHVLAPDQQGLSRYTVNLQGFVPKIRNQITLNNVVFDDLPSGDSSIGSITAFDNQFTTLNNVYPALLNQLAASTTRNATSGSTKVELRQNIYASKTRNNQQTSAYACSASLFPFLTGDLYVSSGSAEALLLQTGTAKLSIRAGVSVTLHAIVQPTMSSITFFAPHAYQVAPGLLAVGSPALTRPIRFYRTDYDGVRRLIGTARLQANGTLATLPVSALRPGTYHFSAEYPGDAYYHQYAFGRITIAVQ